MFNKLRKNYNILCTPAQAYILVSAVAIIASLIQNREESHTYCLGNKKCNLQFNNLFIFAGKIIWMIFWAIVLDSLCKNGYKKLAWTVLLLPLIMMFLLLLIFVMRNA